LGQGHSQAKFGVDTSNESLMAPTKLWFITMQLRYRRATLTFDDSDGIGGTRTYDAENRMKTGVGRTAQWQNLYLIDGDGHRVSETSTESRTWQIYVIEAN